MPWNCPLGPDAQLRCDGCRYQWVREWKCGWYNPARPLQEILTTNERLERMEELFENLSSRVPLRAYAQLRKDIGDIKGRQNWFQQQIDDFFKRKETKQLKKSSKIKGIPVDE